MAIIKSASELNIVCVNYYWIYPQIGQILDQFRPILYAGEITACGRVEYFALMWETKRVGRYKVMWTVSVFKTASLLLQSL